jgi:CRP/FNR family cyclic AMP-dependent transcriptional regulator
MPADTRAKVHELLSHYPRRTYPKAQILIFANEKPEHIFYIIRGRVRKYDTSYRGEDVVVNVFRPPAFFPMSWAINHTPNKYFYKTEIETEVHVIPVGDTLTLLQENPDITLDLLSRVYLGLEGVYGRLVRLMAGTARSRLIYELIIECRRFGKLQADGSYIAGASETDLAAHTGLSRETVSREVSKLKADDVLHSTGKNIIVTDIAKLEQALGGAL